MEGTLSRVRPEQVGQFTMTVASAEPSPEATERWRRRPELLGSWLIAEWRREQGTVGEKVRDDQRRPDEVGDIRRYDLN